MPLGESTRSRKRQQQRRTLDTNGCGEVLAPDGFLVCLGLVAVLLWYLNSYLETKGSLEVVRGFIAPEAQNKIRHDAWGIIPADLEGAHRACSE